VNGNCLQQDGLNALVVGNGAIGSAIAENLLNSNGLQRLVMLQRSDRAIFKDRRVSTFFFDAEDAGSVTSLATPVKGVMGRAHLVINTVGMLHDERQQPEKRLGALRAEDLQRSLTVNAMLLPLLAQAFGGLLRHDQAAVFASLSARVGSIEDNHLGGWYSYRASKAAHNMLLRTIAREWRVSHRNAAVVALHPGTIQSRLSQPFISSNYKNPVRTPVECAESLLQVIAGLSPAASGSFYDWRGDIISW